ncbi:hypothetical protein [Candidatus Villigracilis affinis]|uniref:hypothetical protein n=1 Tax=Candidatus Villigracilis affinis TaxID=3140682 RepID=UPI001DD88AE6|nr:hypothetical protein [Anaerolineales bacterium]
MAKKIIKADDGRQTIDHIRQLAWTGQHASAIDSATQALAAPKTRMRPAEQMSLLDLRAESYIALGKLDLAMKDAKAMMKMGSKVAGLKVQALNRLALVQMRTGDLNAAVKIRHGKAGEIVNRQSKSLYAPKASSALPKRNGAQDNSTPPSRPHKKPFALYQELGDTSGTGRGYWVLAGVFFRSDRGEESRRAAQTALELCRQAGDSYGIGNALLSLANTDVDIAEQIQHYQHAKSAFETAGYVERQGAVMGNLGNTYGELGLHPHGRRLQRELVEIDRAMGAKLA